MPKKSPDSFLVAIPLRMSKTQHARLQARRQVDGLSLQEHIRRAIDDYMDALERKAARPPPPVAPPPPDPILTAAAKNVEKLPLQRAAKPKVTYR